MKSIALTFLCILALSSTAHGQEVPPPAPQSPAAAPSGQPAGGTRITVERDGTRMSVGEEGGCTTVRVCRGAFPRHGAPANGPVTTPPAPPATPPPPPPPPPAMGPAPPPPPVAIPLVAPPLSMRPPVTEHPILPDPARTRLGIMGTAEVLGHGDWMISSRGIVGLLELSVGLGGRFEIGVKTSPVTWFLPDLRFRDALWMAELRAQILRSKRFKLTAELSYFHVAGFHGVRPGLSMKIGGDRVSFHASVGTVLLITPQMRMMDSCIEGPTGDGSGAGCAASEYDSATYDCGGSTKEHRVHPVVHGAMGLEIRLFNHGRLFLEGFAAASPDSPVVASFVPGIRFHSPNFAVDLGLGVISVGGEVVLPLPVLNFSYRW